jgi:hypothetical protein
MYPIIKKMTEELALSEEQADCAFTTIVNQLLNKVPLLEPLIDNIFSDADPEKLNDEVDKVMFLFQQQKMKIFGDWIMPKQTMRIQAGNINIL